MTEIIHCPPARLATLRESVARAIYAVTCRWIAPNFPAWHQLQTFDELDDQERELNLQYADAALAAIEAVRSPADPSPTETPTTRIP